MNLLARTGGQLILGLWAIAPVLVVGLLFLTWRHPVTERVRVYCME